MPRAQVAAGYAPVMPSFAGQVSEDELIRSGRLHQVAGRIERPAAMSETPTISRPTTRLRSWFFTTDHKRIAILYFAGITLFFFIGGAAATLIRLELATPQGDLVSSDVYNRLFTMHGVVMVWFFLIPSIPTTLGNFMRAADDRRARPRVSAAQPRELVSLHARRRL